MFRPSYFASKEEVEAFIRSEERRRRRHEHHKEQLAGVSQQRRIYALQTGLDATSASCASAADLACQPSYCLPQVRTPRATDVAARGSPYSPRVEVVPRHRHPEMDVSAAAFCSRVAKPHTARERILLATADGASLCASEPYAAPRPSSVRPVDCGSTCAKPRWAYVGVHSLAECDAAVLRTPRNSPGRIDRAVAQPLTTPARCHSGERPRPPFALSRRVEHQYFSVAPPLLGAYGTAAPDSARHRFLHHCAGGELFAAPDCLPL